MKANRGLNKTKRINQRQLMQRQFILQG
jgi:hypothetical protein